MRPLTIAELIDYVSAHRRGSIDDEVVDALQVIDGVHCYDCGRHWDGKPGWIHQSTCPGCQAVAMAEDRAR